MTCQYIYTGANASLGKCDQPSYSDMHLPEYHEGCVKDGHDCMLHEFQPEEPEVVYVDLTPLWQDIVLPLALSYANGSKEAGEELKRLARHVDDMRGKATK